jgi:elongation factor Ts
MEITPQMVKELREKTGAGMMACKKALEEATGDPEKAVDILRKKGEASGAKKASRIAAEGMIGHYIHPGSKLGVLVEVNCETDFAARSDDFTAFVKDISMHIAAANPQYVRRDEVPAAELDREKAIYRDKALASKKPEAIIEKIVTGQLENYYKEVCLYDQAFVKDPTGHTTVEQLINTLIGKIGENIRVRRFTRFKTGEGLEKRSTDLAADVREALGG